MTRSRERWAAVAIVALTVALNATVLVPEIDFGRADLNDSVFHLTLVDALAQRLHDGLPVLDFWMPEWAFGYPVVRDYQPLGHWLVAAAHFATGRQFPLDALFSFVRYLLLVLFPLSAYAGCRAASMRPMTAAAVAMLSPLVASPNLYGIEYGSYLWRGNGLYTQLVASHVFVLAVGAGCAAIRRGRRVTLAGLLLALTFLSHFIYGYMAAATLILVAALPDPDTLLRRRFLRLCWIGLLSFGLAAFQILPMMGDGPFINRSRWEPVWKWESFGFANVFGLAATGDLLDANRLPVLSLLALCGVIAIVRRRERAESPFIRTFALAGSILWLFLFCGRAAWGPLFKAIGLSDAAQLHRFIGGAQWFLLLLAALGLTRVWAWPHERRWRYPNIAAAALTIALLWFPVSERLQFLKEGRAWGNENLAAYETQRAAIEETIAAVRQAGGRAYPGLAAQWGMQFRVGYVPFYAFLSRAHIPAVAFLYHSMGLPGDLMVRFNEQRPDHYRLFDIRTAVAETTRPMPAFLTRAANIGAFSVFRAPASGMFDLVQAPRSVYADRRTFFDVNDAWLQSAWPASRAHLVLDYESAVPTVPRPRLADLTAPPPVVSCGRVVEEHRRGDAHHSTVDVTADQCLVMVKTTYHPRWRATVDGAPRRPIMLTPGFLGIPVTRGRHSIDVQYAPGPAKVILLMLAVPLLLASFIAERRQLLRRLEERSEKLAATWTPDRAYALLVLLALLPVVMPFVSATQPSGHDVLQYLPRVTEFHENIRHGVLLPRWAPDLSSGQGQPLFLLNPPLFYFLTELFYVAGFSFLGAMNAACVLLIVAAAAAMFLLARHLFGAAGGAIAALAYVYAPYFLVDLYVRTAFAEFAAFPFYPLVLYGFIRHAESRERRWLLVAAVSYAAIWFAHTPAALLFSPLLGAFLLFTAWRARDARLFVTQAIAAAFGMLLAATAWLPSAVEAEYTHAHRLTEGALNYAAHFVGAGQFFGWKWGYGTSVPGPDDGMPFTLGWPHLVIAAIAMMAVARWSSERWKSWNAFFAAAAIVQCFLMTQRAHAMWDAIPQIQYVAFPWRLLAPVTFCMALLAGSLAVALNDRWRMRATIAAIAILVLPSLPHAQPASYLTLDPEQWTPEQIAARGAVAGTFDTFEPRSIEARPVYDGRRVEVDGGSGTARVIERGPVDLRATIAASAPTKITLPLSHFPGWRIRIDGAEVVEEPPSASGRIRVSIGAGAHTVDAHFGRTPIRWMADALSAAAALLVMTMVALRRRRPTISS